jgi:Flp pilus assembly pilin Flp
MSGWTMVGWRALFRRYRADERAATAIEYALICGIIAVAVISIASVGGALDSIYTDRIANIIGALGGGGGDDD